MQIDFTNNGWDAHVIALARQGLSANVIADRCNLSVGQVRTRLTKNGVHITNYRNGVSKESREVLESTRRLLYQTYQSIRAPKEPRNATRRKYAVRRY